MTVYGIWTLRLAGVVVALVLWFWTQRWLGRRPAGRGGIGDAIHDWTRSAHGYLLIHTHAANALLVCSSLGIDLVGLMLLGLGVFGSTVRPLLGLFLVFGLRQASQAICALPPPPGMIWRHPGWPSLLVTYGVANDLFFSGHTAIAVLGAVELCSSGSVALGVLGVGLAVFEAVSVLLLRAHYTMDVMAGAAVALLVGRWAAAWAPACDSFLSGLLH